MEYMALKVINEMKSCKCAPDICTIAHILLWWIHLQGIGFVSMLLKYVSRQQLQEAGYETDIYAYRL